MGARTNGREEGTDRKRTAARIELHVRSLSPPGCRGRQERVIERLRALEVRDAIDGFSVSVWGTDVPLDGPLAAAEATRRRLRQAARFERWAREAGVTLATCTREATPMATDNSYRELRVPTMSLAEFHGNDLYCVSPHTDGDTTRTVTDRLCALERETTPGRASPDEATPGRTNPATDTHDPTERVVPAVGVADE